MYLHAGMSEHMQRSTIKVVLRHVIGGFRRYAHVRVQALAKKKYFSFEKYAFCCCQHDVFDVFAISKPAVSCISGYQP